MSAMVSKVLSSGCSANTLSVTGILLFFRNCDAFLIFSLVKGVCIYTGLYLVIPFGMHPYGLNFLKYIYVTLICSISFPPRFPFSSLTHKGVFFVILLRYLITL